MSNKTSIDTVYGILKNKLVLLLILDGWGLSPSWSGNAISFSNPKNFNTYWRMYPHAVLQAFRGVVDRNGIVGNSEIGHASIGTGRIVKQDLTEINEAIRRGYFFQNPTLLSVMRHVRKFKSNLHLVGMLSDGGIHSHFDHLLALLKLAKSQKLDKVCIHVITDGIDTPDRSAIIYLQRLQNYLAKNQVGKIVSIIGRYYAMDKGAHTDRIEKAYLLETKAKGKKFSDPISALKHYYSEGIYDSHIPPMVIGDGIKNIVDDYDGLIFYNFRPDRMRSLAQSYTDKNYFRSIFGRRYRMLKDFNCTSLTSYMLDKNATINTAFPAVIIQNSLAALLSRAGLRQLHIAEAEKNAHVTYFFNGGKVEPFPGEDRIIVPSVNVASYDQNPKMSTEKIATEIIKAIKSTKYQFIIANIANVDMVAHTGNILATSEAIRFTDEMIKKIVNANTGNITIICADHGNAEQIIPYKTSSNRETFHTVNPVPLILVQKNKAKDLVHKALQSTHIQMYDLLNSPYNLADIAPTILELFGIAKPQDMTGQSLLNKIGYK